LENLSISTNTNLKLPGAGLKGPSYPDPSTQRARRLVWSRSHGLARELFWRKTDNWRCNTSGV
jgi:hypothetical protein